MSDIITCYTCTNSFPESNLANHVQDRHVGPRSARDLFLILCGQCEFTSPDYSIQTMMRHCYEAKHDPEKVSTDWQTFQRLETDRVIKLLRVGVRILSAEDSSSSTEDSLTKDRENPRSSPAKSIASVKTSHIRALDGGQPRKPRANSLHCQKKRGKRKSPVGDWETKLSSMDMSTDQRDQSILRPKLEISSPAPKNACRASHLDSAKLLSKEKRQRNYPETISRDTEESSSPQSFSTESYIPIKPIADVAQSGTFYESSENEDTGSDQRNPECDENGDPGLETNTTDVQLDSAPPVKRRRKRLAETGKSLLRLKSESSDRGPNLSCQICRKSLPGHYRSGLRERAVKHAIAHGKLYFFRCNGCDHEAGYKDNVAKHLNKKVCNGNGVVKNFTADSQRLLREELEVAFPDVDWAYELQGTLYYGIKLG